MASDFPGAFKALREILRRHAGDLIVQADTPTDYVVLSPALGPNKRPLWFGAVTSKRSAVSFHLMPLYFNPALQAQVDDELLPRKQGKTCFNFQRPDPALFVRLDALTRTARETWERFGFLTPGPLSQERLDAALRQGGEDPARIARQRKAMAAQAAAKRAATKKSAAKAAVRAAAKRPAKKRPAAKTRAKKQAPDGRRN